MIAHVSPTTGSCNGFHFKSKLLAVRISHAGPFETDHWQNVFGNEAPLANRNQSANIDLSPAVRDFLGSSTAVSGLNGDSWTTGRIRAVPGAIGAERCPCRNIENFTLTTNCCSTPNPRLITLSID